MYRNVLVRNKFFKVEKPSKKQTRTHFVQRASGLMDGRTSGGANDETSVMRLTRDVDVNKDNKIDHRDMKKGQIIGRLSPGESKPKQVQVRRHWREGKPIRGYRR